VSQLFYSESMSRDTSQVLSIFLPTPCLSVFVCVLIILTKSRSGLLEQICDEKSRPRGSGPSSQRAEEAAPGGVLSSTFSSWGRKLSGALDSGKQKVWGFQLCVTRVNNAFRSTNLFEPWKPTRREAWG
jgi:hypothetical protein